MSDMRQETDSLGVVEVSTLPSKPLLAHEQGCCSAPAVLEWSTTRLGEVNVPVAVVAGEHDPLDGPDVVRRVAHLVKRANFETITAAAHLCNLERPDAFNRALLTLDSVEFVWEQGLWESGPSRPVTGDVSMTPMLSRTERARP